VAKRALRAGEISTAKALSVWEKLLRQPQPEGWRAGRSGSRIG